MEKIKNEKIKKIILDFLETKFNKCELIMDQRSGVYTRCFLADTLFLEIWIEDNSYSANFHENFLVDFAKWFPNIKNRKKILKEWFLKNYNNTLPEGCSLSHR
jgi:hypothetical protein